MWPVLLLCSAYFVFISKSSGVEGWPEFSSQQMLQHMAVPHPAAAPAHTELQDSPWLGIATELGLNLHLTRILSFCGMVLLFLINYSKLSQPMTASLQTTPEVLKAGLELTGAVRNKKHSPGFGREHEEMP